MNDSNQLPVLSLSDIDEIEKRLEARKTQSDKDWEVVITNLAAKSKTIKEKMAWQAELQRRRKILVDAGYNY